MLTRAMQRCLQAIEQRQGQTFTQRDIASDLGRTPHAVHALVTRMIQRGFLVRRNHRIEIVNRIEWLRFDAVTKHLVSMERPVLMKVKRLPHGDGLPVPAKSMPGDSGIDVAAADDVIIGPGQWAMCRTGFQIELQPGYEAQVRPRSGLSRDHGITVLNAPGTIDNAYRARSW